MSEFVNWVLPTVVLSVIGLAAMAILIILAQVVVGSLRSTRVLTCDSCRERMVYANSDIEPVANAIARGWLALPGNVHYCPRCAELAVHTITLRPRESAARVLAEHPEIADTLQSVYAPPRT